MPFGHPGLVNLRSSYAILKNIVLQILRTITYFGLDSLWWNGRQSRGFFSVNSKVKIGRPTQGNFYLFRLFMFPLFVVNLWFGVTYFFHCVFAFLAPGIRRCWSYDISAAEEEVE